MSSRLLCIALHDVAPATLDACRLLRRLVHDHLRGAPVTLLVVPAWHGAAPAAPPAYRQWLSACIGQGDEPALHGYTHLDDAPPASSWGDRLRRRVYTAGEGEFAALGRDEARERMIRGTAWCRSLGFDVTGFVAPAWLMSPGAWAAARDCGFAYTTTLHGIHALPSGRRIAAPTLTWSTRSRWRRIASRGWNGALARATQSAPVLRIGLHPADAYHPEIVDQIGRLLPLVARGRLVVTKREAVIE